MKSVSKGILTLFIGLVAGIALSYMVFVSQSFRIVNIVDREFPAPESTAEYPIQVKEYSIETLDGEVLSKTKVELRLDKNTREKIPLIVNSDFMGKGIGAQVLFDFEGEVEDVGVTYYEGNRPVIYSTYKPGN